MHDLRTIQIPKITDGIKFEYLCRDIWKNNKDKYELVQFNGRPGQPQDGVDVFGREIDDQQWFGVQCKARKDSNKLGKREIIEEMAKALKFNPMLRKYMLMTTLDRDVKIQEMMRTINMKPKIKFTFELLFWEDIEELLKREENFNIYYKYYQSFFADNTTLGHSIGKLLNLELGTGDSTDTHYELMIGKIPDYRDKSHNEVDYYRGTYFIVNFHERKMETFPIPCFESDLEMAFRYKFDRFRIAKWLNSIKNIDDFICNDESSFESYITIEEHKKFIESLHEEA